MEQFVIIEKLKELIEGKKVIAAVFYSYNFSARFFENYLLTAFLPHVNFSDNEIQNNILWRKYAGELPDVTVYCDFHAKSADAPSLNYSVRTIDLPEENGKKACFHPKVSFVLLEDWTLIFLTGSNNLTEGGWCENKEIVSIERLKNNEYFQYNQKHQLWDFLKHVKKICGKAYTPAEEKMDSFFSQRLYNGNARYQFYSSHISPFCSFLKKILDEDDEEQFQYIEILSPSLSKGTKLIEDLKSIVSEENIFLNTPFKSSDEIDITEVNYYKFKEAGVKWSILNDNESNKGFRKNHSKVYRLKTSKNAYIAIGSVNFTQAAWRGRKENGNVETAIIYKEPLENWKPWLAEYEDPNMKFVEEQSDEPNNDNRLNVPDLDFKLNWREETLTYTNFKNCNFSGQIRFNNRNFELKEGKNIVIHLKDDIIDELADNPIIRVWQYHVRRELIYYPVQEGYESKPIPQKLKLKDGELLQLWENVSVKKQSSTEITELIEKFIMSRMNVDGDIERKDELSKSTLNLMASHISALIRLEERIFDTPKLKRDFAQAKELIDYYLFVSNIDTLAGYRKLLAEMYQENNLLPGVYWFLLNVLLKDFYDKNKIRRFYKSINENDSDLHTKLKHVTGNISGILNTLKKELNNNGLNIDMLKWIKTEL